MTKITQEYIDVCVNNLHTEICTCWPEEYLNDFFLGGYVNSDIRSHLIRYHSQIGMTIRNEYKLWEFTWEPELDDIGVDISEFHPDEVSYTILKNVWKKGLQTG